MNSATRHENVKRKALELLKAGRLQEAKLLFKEVLKKDRKDIESWHCLGSVYGRLGLYKQAEECCRKVVRIHPDHAGGCMNLGLALLHQNKFSESEKCFRKALRLRPGFAEAYYNLGLSYRLRGEFDKATINYRKALQISPAYVEALVNLANVLQDTKEFDEAVIHYQAALRYQPGFVEAKYNLANCYAHQGRLEAAVKGYQEVLAVAPDHRKAYSNFLFLLNYDPGLVAADIYREHALWGEKQIAAVSSFKEYVNQPDEAKRIRLGYVSPDLRTHAVAFVFEPLLAHRDKVSFEVFCYSDVAKPDNVTTRLRSMVDEWRDVSGLGDDQLAQLIRQDKVDILVDLAGHSADNRLLVFALKPAPVQVTYLGYPATTGLPTIDYRVTDAFTDLPGDEDYYVEKLVKLDDIFACYAPPACAPDVSVLPALDNGFVTFGSLNTLAKINSEVIMLWSLVLKAVPGSRLMMLRDTLKGTVKNEMYEKFTANGVFPERVQLLDKVPSGGSHFEMYGDIDIALDPFPWTGHVTTCEALWMGVPVVTLYGDRHVGRNAADMLTAVGLSKLVASTLDDYVNVARGLSARLQELETMRAGLRRLMFESVVCDGKRFSRQMEKRLRELWHIWCDKNQ